MMDEKLITTTDAAKMMGVSASRVRQLILEGRLMSVKLGRDQLLRRDDVEAFSTEPRLRTGRPPIKKS